MELVSVIIPLYNRKSLIQDTLNSLKVDLHPGVHLDVIVVDDGSIDGGAELIEKLYPQIQLVRQKNAGAPVARNSGLKLAKGDYVLFLDSDDLIEPDFFQEKIKVLQKNPEAEVAYGPSEHFRIRNGEIEILKRHRDYPLVKAPDYIDHLERLLGGWYIPPHSLLWKKNVVHELNGYDVSLPVNQDVDLLFRLLIGKRNMIGVDSPKALYREHESDQRTGVIEGNADKLKAILLLRKNMARIILAEYSGNRRIRKSFAKFCFDCWNLYRTTFPAIAEEFYALSQILYPSLNVDGGLWYRCLGKMVGAKRAAILKSYLKA